MSTIAATAVALAAGIVEGKSVLDHLQKQQKEHSDDLPTNLSSTVMPSIMYGFASMPLTLIGASPSVQMIYPNSSQAEETLAYNPLSSENTNPSSNTTSSTFEGRPPRRRLKLDPQEIIDKMEVTDDERSNAQFQMKQMQSRRVRQENRQAVATKNFTPNQTLRDSHASNSRNFAGKGLSSFVATLDGKPLPTPLAEGMRRVRILACTYGLVSLAVAYQLNSSSKETIEDIQETIPINDGRNVKEIQNFVRNCRKHNSNESEDKDGVAIRLLSNNNDWISYLNIGAGTESQTKPEYKHHDCVLPVVTNDFETTNSVRADKMLHWTLGNNEQAWIEIPIDISWFFHHGTKPFLILESKVCSSFYSCIEEFCSQKNKINAPYDNGNHEIAKIQKSILDGKKIHKKAAKVSNLQQSGDEGTCGTVHVFLGSGHGGYYHQNVKNDDEIYIEALGAIRHALLEQIKVFQSLPSALKDNTDNEDVTPLSLEEDIESEGEMNENLRPIQLVEGLGKYIRQRGLSIVQQLGKTLSNLRTLMQNDQHDLTIHIFCDKVEIEEWLSHSLIGEKGIKLKFHRETNHQVDESILTKISQEDVILFLCSNDTATINLASNAISKSQEMKCKNFVTLVESVSSKETIEALTMPHVVNTSSETLRSAILCTSSIYEELFATTRDLVSGGKSATEAQKALDELYR